MHLHLLRSLSLTSRSADDLHRRDYNHSPLSHLRFGLLTVQDDCYLSEISALVDVIDGKAPQSAILSTYADALESYKLVCRSLLCTSSPSERDGVLMRRADLGDPERRGEGVRGARRSEAVEWIRMFICMIMLVLALGQALSLVWPWPLLLLLLLL